MKQLIVYGSHYGTTKCYAEKLAEITGIDLMNFEEVKSLEAYQTVIHFGGLYAGGVRGLKEIAKILPESTNLIIVTVGLADVSDQDNITSIRRSISSQISHKIYDESRIIHLRGGIDYKKLNFLHKTMMSLMYKKVKSIPEEKKTAENRAMIDTYDQQVDFIDYNSLESVVEAIKMAEIY